MSAVTQQLTDRLGGQWHQVKEDLWYERGSLRYVRGKRSCGCPAPCRCPREYTLYEAGRQRRVNICAPRTERQQAAAQIVRMVTRRVYTDGDKINGRALIQEIERKFKV